MKLRNFAVWSLVLGLILSFGGPVFAGDDRPKEGKVITLDTEAMVLTVQGDKNDQWTLYWTETTKLKGDLTVPEMKVGDKIKFDYTEKDGKMWLTELKRTDKAKG